jgi:hypothetical protein
MLLKRVFLVAVISLYPNFIQKSTGQLPACDSDAIEKGMVTGCVCGGGTDRCSTRCPAGKCAHKPIILSNTHLTNCGSVPDIQNRDCRSSYIWFNLLCSCLQTGGCSTSSGTPHHWVKLSDKLITANTLIHDILELQLHTSLRDQAWEYGQSLYNPTIQALAINSAHSITEAQIHMHICPLNAATRDFLSELSLSPTSLASYSKIRATKPFITVWCRASQTPNKAITGVSEDISTVLDMVGVCDNYVGAAVVTDINGYTWSCVTADDSDTEHRFCY